MKLEVRPIDAKLGAGSAARILNGIPTKFTKR